jgi:hypothetical protein
MLQQRVVGKFGEALARAGHHAFQLELQEFTNTTIAAEFLASETLAPVIDFASPASARDIMRADLTEGDLNPDSESPLSPRSLTLPVLDTLRVERRGTVAEASLLDEVLSRQVDDENYFAVIQLLVDSADSLETEVLDLLTDKHLSQALAQMTDSEILAFAFRSELPVLSEEAKATVRMRLNDIKVDTPVKFASSATDTFPDANPQNLPRPSIIQSPELPTLVRAPQNRTPEFTDAEELLAGSATMRNAIETIINDTE